MYKCLQFKHAEASFNFSISKLLYMDDRVYRIFYETDLYIRTLLSHLILFDAV